MPLNLKHLAATTAVLAASAASAQNITVTIENLQPADGFSLTPVWVGVHNGTFTNFENGASADGYAGLEAIAELGDTTTRSGAFNTIATSGVDATFASGTGAPVFEPGESQTFTLDVVNGSVNRFFSFAAMVVPSNDLFVGNPGLGAELFDAGGNFNGAMTFDLFGTSVWDAGTEVNDIASGPAFVVGQDATAGTTEGGVIQPLFNDANAGAYLDSILGTQTPVNTISSRFGEATPLYRITVTPEPATLGLLGLFGLALVRRR